MSEKALQIAEKRNKRQRRKGKIHPFCAEFQRVARRDKKAFLNDHCKKKKKKTIEWERLETSSRKLEIPRAHFMQVQFSSVQSLSHV